MTDWDQIILRNVRNAPLPEGRDKNIDVSVVVGSRRKRKLSFGSPFLLDATTVNWGEGKEITELLNRVKLGVDGMKLLVSYSGCSESHGLLNRNCILKLDGPQVDVGLLGSMDIGAYFVDLTEAYPKLVWSNNPVYYMDTNMDTGSPACRNSKKAIDFRQIYDQEQITSKCIFSLRELRPDIPFGIRIPANYIERDCLLAVTSDVDFIILDCPDTSGNPGLSNAVVPSLPALARINRILLRLYCDHISVITGIPPLGSPSYLKLFAMGSDLLMFSYPQDMAFGQGDKEGKVISGFSRDTEVALTELKRAIYLCGCNNLKEAGTGHLLTSSSDIKLFADIPALYDPDPVLLPFLVSKETIGRSRVCHGKRLIQD